MAQVWVVSFRFLKPLIKVFVVFLVNNNHLELTFILLHQQLGQEPSELRLLLLAGDDDADVYHVLIGNSTFVRFAVYFSNSSFV